MADKQMTMQDGITEMLVTIAKVKAGPDADEQFLNDLEQVLLAKIKQGSGNMGQPGQPGAQQAGNPSLPGGGGSPVAGPGGPPPTDPTQAGQQQQSQLAGAPNPGQGVMARPEMPNPDEMRRMLETRTGK